MIILDELQLKSTALKIYDADGTHRLTIKHGTNLSGDHVLELLPPANADCSLNLGNGSNVIPAGASQSQMEAEAPSTVYVSPSTTKYSPGVAKAWCRVTTSSGSPVLGASYNVSSIGDRGTGKFTVNLTTAFSAADYGVTATGRYTNGTTALAFAQVDDSGSSFTTSAFRVDIIDNAGTPQDAAGFFAAAHGDQ